MKKLLLCILLALPALALGVGDSAPDFKLTGADGKTYSLPRARWAVLSFFPKPFTPGCTTQCNAMRDDSAALAVFDAEFLLLNTSSVELNEKFAAKKGYKFPLLADVEGNTARAYGVLIPGGIAARRTFVVDPSGVVRAAFDVDPARTVAQLVSTLEELKVPRR